MSSGERTGWRDQEISLRHRDWGFNCPAVDLDFVLLEFNWGVPVAVVDYKHHSKKDPFEGLNEFSVKAMSSLYDEHGNQLPFFITRYWKGEEWSFEALALNEPARRFSPASVEWVRLSEESWVKGLYLLRRRALNLRDRTLKGRPLAQELPPEEECGLPIPAWLRKAKVA